MTKNIKNDRKMMERKVQQMQIKTKTISCHYDSIFCMEHNNRDIISANVDITRTPNNYNCVVTGGKVLLDYEIPMCWLEIRKEYRKIVQLYWQEQSAVKSRMYDEYWECVRRLNRLYYTHGETLGLAGTVLSRNSDPIGFLERWKREQQYLKGMRELKDEISSKEIEMILSNTMKHAHGNSIRLGLLEYDRIHETHYLERMDRAISKMAEYVEDLDNMELRLATEADTVPRFATIEEIYDHVYEPSFRAFQDKQRPCRRYEGTYLAQIRERQARERQKKQQNKNSKCHTPAEAIEFVIGIGDMDNTGYICAPEDAYKSEILLKDYCDYLLTNAPNICVVTTKELDNPNWQPPFNNGLIVLNMVVHADEATPGIHLTCIPYSRGCKRGPAVQASLGRAMAGMGYPSTWKDILDENGERIPKRDRKGDIVMNKDGSIRYQQEPDRQGVIDWIEDQKAWLQTQMQRRYDWSREYKGSHVRGNLSIPDYKVARAKERQEEIDRQIEALISGTEEHISNLISRLDESVDDVWKETSYTIIAKYIQQCPEEFDRILKQAREYLDKLPMNEHARARSALNALIQDAQRRTGESESPKKENGITR